MSIDVDIGPMYNCGNYCNTQSTLTLQFGVNFFQQG